MMVTVEFRLHAAAVLFFISFYRPAVSQAIDRAAAKTTSAVGSQALDENGTQTTDISPMIPPQFL